MGDFETAKLVFERLLEIDPGNALAKENLTAVRGKMEGPAEPAVSSQAGLTSTPGSGPVDDAGRAAEGPKSGSTPKASAPSSSSLFGEHLFRANTRWTAGDPQGASLALREAIKLDPENHEVRAALGSVLFQAGDGRRVR